MDTVECISIRPSRISIYTEFLPSGKSYSKAVPFWESENSTPEVAPGSDAPAQVRKVKQPNSNRSGARLSEKAIQRIQDRVDWLVLFSKRKTGYNPKTKSSFTFKINFITLTLPVLQFHDDRVIKSQCFNQFLVETRKRCNLKNFVWRAEPQGNGNIHFHLISDVYLNAYVIREIWNRCLGKLGYIDQYQSKFSKLSFNEYRDIVDPKIGRAKTFQIAVRTGNKKLLQALREKKPGAILRKKNIPIDSLLKRYEYGKSTNWRSPNTTDVHSTKHVRDIAAYLKKYVSKNIDPTPDENSVASTGEIIDNRPDLKARRIKGRLWGCSQSLSKMKPMHDYGPCLPDNFLNDIADTFPDKVRYFDYATCIYVPIRRYIRRHLVYMKQLIDKLLEKTGYTPSLNRDQRYYLDSTISFVT